MSADSPKYHHSPKLARGDPHLVTPQEVTDPSILESVAGFINDVVPTSYTIAGDITDQIQWANFEQLEFDELSFVSDIDCEKIVPPPLILILGYSTGIQIWCIAANGEATEILAWRHGSIKVVRILPSPHKVEGNFRDSFLSKRPLIALCDNASPGPPYCALSFMSLRTGEQVKLIKFKNPILDVRANKHSVVVSFSEKIAVFDAFTLEDRCTVTTCYLSPGIQPNPIALGSRWLAYAEKTLITSRKSSAGCDSEGVQSYKATMIQCAKSLGKGIKEFGETVANSLTGNSTFKPGVVCPGSPQSGGSSDGSQKGVVTILDIQCNQMDNVEKSIPAEAFIAHFIAHNEAVVSLEFDPSGMLLLTADKRGHDFHIFRIHPHPVGSSLASVHHLYILHRGDTTAKVQDMCFSPDSRWVTVSTLRGTTHVFPITPYGGNVGVRTHTTQHVVNKMSRFHRSAGLTGEDRSNSPVSGLETSSGHVFPYINPRFPPYPHPTVIQPLAQIRQPMSIQPSGLTQPRSGNTRQRLSSSSEDSISLRVVACFASPRAYMDTLTSQESAHKKTKPVDSLFVMGCHGSLIQYDLDPYPVPNVPKEKLCDDTPIELKTSPMAQWVLQRQPNAVDVPLPLKQQYLNFFIPMEPSRKKTCTDQNDDHWLSQVEIVTHAGPHRRLWMGPQFTFKTYTTASGCPFSLTNIQQIDIGRSQPVNMPVTQNAVFIECGSANSRELSPPMNTYHTTFDEIGGIGELQLREDLADAMLESPGIRETGGERSNDLEDDPGSSSNSIGPASRTPSSGSDHLLELAGTLDAVYIPPEADTITNKEEIDDEYSQENNAGPVDIAGKFELHDFHKFGEVQDNDENLINDDLYSSDYEILASKNQCMISCSPPIFQQLPVDV
ncbi:hypothetical protein HHI36_011473 [Cryptolaemus montrouzieri]|uniref:BCAS3 domain-containing protein n=1 Tax=Cryptolaemus montrouzieri TaxID=559131 RepID=A0ABD2MM29_9CUCU